MGSRLSPQPPGQAGWETWEPGPASGPHQAPAHRIPEGGSEPLGPVPSVASGVGPGGEGPCRLGPSCCWPAGVCSGWGDPHYITFDGTYYTFLDNCTYVLVQQIVPVYGHFRVLIDNYFCNSLDGLSCPRSIIVEYQQDRVVLTRRPVLGVLTNQVGTPLGSCAVHRGWGLRSRAAADGPPGCFPCGWAAVSRSSSTMRWSSPASRKTASWCPRSASRCMSRCPESACRSCSLASSSLWRCLSASLLTTQRDNVVSPRPGIKRQ